MRLAGLTAIDWENESHIVRAAVGTMRRVLVDSARARRAGKRIPRNLFATCPDLNQLVRQGDSPINFVSLDGALRELEQIDRRKAEVVELRYFGGQSVR